MAIDSRNKRGSVLGIDLGFLKVFPTPDGTIVSADSQNLLGKYSGIAFAGAAPATSILLLVACDMGNIGDMGGMRG